MSDRIRAAKAVDTVMTEVVYSAYQAKSLINFVAPTVNVNSRTGKIITFDKNQFAVASTKRTPYAEHKRGKISGYNSNLAYILEQHTYEAEVSWEEIEEAANSPAQFDLHELAVMDAVAKIEQSLEQEMYNLITNPANYEPGNAIVAPVASKFTNAGSDPEQYIASLINIVRSKLGRYPTRAIISEDVYRALVLHPIFRDRVKYTSTASINTQLLANWFNLPGGIEVAMRIKVDPVTGNLVDMFPQGTMLLFVDGRDEIGSLAGAQESLFKPTPGIGITTATFAQMYAYKDGLTVSEIKSDDTRDVDSATVRFTGSIVLPSVGDNNKSSAGLLISQLV